MLETPFTVNHGDDLCVGDGEASDDFRGISLRQSVDFSLPSTSYVIAPGVVYNGNRLLVSPQPYCPHFPTEGVTPDGPQPETAKHYHLIIDGKVAAEESFNYLRKRIHRLQTPQSARIVELEILATHGVREARIFEMCCY